MAAKNDKVIITCAVTGGIHTPTMSEALPVTPAEIATQAIDAAEAGAAIVHLHARNPKTGEPTSEFDAYMEFLPRIKQGTDAIVNITTGGGLKMTIEERLAAPSMASPELCSLNMGSMNLGLFNLANKYDKWKFGWEDKYLRDTRDYVQKNSFADIEKVIEVMGGEHGTKFEHECYDLGHLYNLAHFVDRGLIKPPFMIQFIFGLLGGMGADLRNLTFVKETADHLFGDDYYWSVLAAGKHQMTFATQSVLMGGNVRVGLEDSLYISKGQLAKSNAEQVSKIRRIIEEVGLEVATPAEARRALGLKGGDQVGF